MRIVLLCRSFPWHRQGGMEWHAWDIAAGLAARGHTLTLVTSPDGRQTNAAHDFMENLATQGALTPQARERLRIIECGRPRAGLYSPSFLRESARIAMREVREGRADVIHAQGFAGFFLPDAGDSMPPAQRIPWAVTIHGTLWSETWMDARARRFLPPAQRLLLPWRYRHRLAAVPLWRRMLLRAPRIMTDSRFTQHELLREFPALEPKIRVVPLGIDLRRFPGLPPQVQPDPMPNSGSQPPPNAPPPPARLLMLGRIERSKGFHMVIEALARCRNAMWTLDIAGEGPERPTLERQAARLGLASRLRFLGRIPPENLAKTYAEADLFLNPDLTQPAFGLVALESMIQGTPVLASRAGALPEVVGEAGWLLPPGDIPAWAAMLDNVLTHRDLLRQRRAPARQRALSAFPLDAMLDGIEAALQQVAHNPSATP